MISCCADRFGEVGGRDNALLSVEKIAMKTVTVPLPMLDAEGGPARAVSL